MASTANIDSVMSRDVRSIAPTASLKDAAALMADLNVGSLPVCDGERIVGMITDRDLTVRGTAAGLNPLTSKVGELLSADAHTVLASDSIERGLQLMAQMQVRRLPVIDAKGKLVGIVSLGDLATRQERPVEGTLEKISEP